MRLAATMVVLALCSFCAPARADEDELAGKWLIEQIRDAGAFDAAKTSFELLPNGRVATTVGCNRVIGEPEIRGDRVRFGALAATRMACPPPFDALERHYGAALEAVRRFRFDGEKLVLSDAKGEALIQLRRAD